MSWQRRIRYAIDTSTGMVVSEVGDQFAWAVLDFAGMKPENNWQMNFNLERISRFSEGVRYSYKYLRFTRKLPVEIKNFHRIFWGMPPLKVKV